jgi:hypothetical protein
VSAHEHEPLEAHLLATLSEACREKLTGRRHHGDWREMADHELRDWLTDETNELTNALFDHACAPTPETLAAVRSECANVALLAGMILDTIERAPLRAGDTEAARWAERNRVLEARLQAVREVVR